MQNLTVKQIDNLSFDYSVEIDEKHFVQHLIETNPDQYLFVSYVLGTCIATCGDIEISFEWKANADNAKTYEDAFKFNISVDEEGAFSEVGITIIDEDGKALESFDIARELCGVFDGKAWVKLVKEILPVKEINSPLFNEGS